MKNHEHEQSQKEFKEKLLKEQKQLPPEAEKILKENLESLYF